MSEIQILESSGQESPAKKNQTREIAEISFLDEVIDQRMPVPHGAPCAVCGAPVEDEDRFCGACGTAHGDEPGDGTLVEEQGPHKHFRCNNCGAEVATDPDQRSYVCAFCDSTYVVELGARDGVELDTNDALQLDAKDGVKLGERPTRQRPEFVIGFAVTPEKAEAIFRRWIRQGGWFRPTDLPVQMVADKLKGVYLPFWSFSMLAQSRWSASIGEYWYRTETYTTRDSKGKLVTKTRRVRETEWWPLSGRHHRYYSGYLISGSQGLPQQQAQRIKPFHLPALKRFRPYFLAGWLCEEYSVARDEALRRCREEFQRREQHNVSAFLPGDTHRGLEVQTQFTKASSDLCLLPIYLFSYRYRDRLYRFLVNGQTGKAAGDKPFAWKRLWLTVLGVLGGVLLIGGVIALFSAVWAR